MELQKSNILTHFYLRLLHESCSLFCCLMWESDTSKSAFPLVRLGSGVQLGRGPQLGRHTKDCAVPGKLEIRVALGIFLFIAPGQKGSLRNTCVCVCVCVYMHTYMGKHIYARIPTCTWSVCIHVYIHTHLHVYSMLLLSHFSRVQLCATP